MTYVPELGRQITLRPGTTDQQTLQDVIAGRYHLPPASMPTPATVLDLGANIGLTAAHYARLWPQALITAVEMDAGNAAVAAQNWPGGMIIEAAVVSEAQAAFGDVRGYDPGMPEEAYALGTGTTKPRAFYTLSELCAVAAGVVPVDFVKMDVEGMEWFLLDEAEGWAPQVRHLLVELHLPEDPASARMLGASKLDALGFDSEASTHPAGLFAWRR